MNPHSLPPRTTPRGYRPLAILRALPGLRTAAVVIGFGGPMATVSADDVAPPPLPSRPAGVTDAVASGKVLKALDEDPVLRRVNLVVSVVDGVAVIGGPVSSPVIAKRAEDLVRQIPEIKQVRNGCFVTPGPDPLLKAVAEKMKPSSLPPRPSMTELPGVASPQPVPAAPNSNQVAYGPGGSTVVAHKPSQSPSDGYGMLGSPVGASGPASIYPASVRDPAAAPGTAPGRLTGSAGTGFAPRTAADILTSAGNVKKVEARFARLTIELKDGVLVIGGTSPRPGDAWDLAEQLRQIPGVTRVAIATGR